MLSTDIASEKAPVEAANYSHDQLKHVETKESHTLPTVQGMFACIVEKNRVVGV